MADKAKITNRNFLKQSVVDELMNAAWRKTTLVSRGAYIYCSKGTHEDILNQTEKNGVFLNGNPIMTVKDCKVSPSESEELAGVPYREPKPEVEGNLHSFGYCRSEFHPLKVGNVGVPYKPKMQDYDPDTGVTKEGDENRLYPCVPIIMPKIFFSPFGLDIAGGEWENGHEKIKINGVPALTSKSCLRCLYGGEIKLLSNGMEPVPGELMDQRG
ncbi:DUF4280 domain-containing protein [Paenibacillus sp. alder61]|uniref:DUF4280 domain-containing protein n=1 Tax=Paenibacillus faecis TaxID=862114 RepID=A0A5D0CM53_9BACL|nr:MULTISPECIES: DUF4280 domain-containing protein [Paenibacillus]MCA1295006.1 DUF4280 domain-containing protein [Paenibacillus sp. alder61]TYA10732.1 DUF4280 domain-containing protein [Paenibacillus faecis]